MQADALRLKDSYSGSLSIHTAARSWQIQSWISEESLIPKEEELFSLVSRAPRSSSTQSSAAIFFKLTHLHSAAALTALTSMWLHRGGAPFDSTSRFHLVQVGQVCSGKPALPRLSELCCSIIFSWVTTAFMATVKTDLQLWDDQMLPSCFRTSSFSHVL